MQNTKTAAKAKFLNLKIPLGGLLIFYGIVLDFYGLITDKTFYQKSLGIDINLIWGSVMLLLGLILIAIYFFTDRKQLQPVALALEAEEQEEK